MKSLLALLIGLAPVSALAASYGDVAACRDYVLSDSGAPSFFDGKEIIGQDWSCDLAGHCEGEGKTWSAKFIVSVRPNTVSITAPDGTITVLGRCP